MRTKAGICQVGKSVAGMCGFCFTRSCTPVISVKGIVCLWLPAVRVGCSLVPMLMLHPHLVLTPKAAQLSEAVLVSL